MRLNALPFALALLAAIQISGCGDADNKSAAQPSAAKADRPLTEAELRAEKERRVFNPTPEERAEDAARKEAEERARQPVVTTLDEPPAAPDFSEYKAIQMATQLVFLQSALSNEPIDALAIAKGYSFGIAKYDLGDVELSKLLGEFVNTRDQFTQRDIAKRLEPVLQKHVDKYKPVRYVKVTMTTRDSLDAYNFDKQGFAFTPNAFNDVFAGTADERRELRRSGKTIIDRGTIGFTDNHQYQVAFENGRDFRFIKVEDESVARAIEAVVKRPGSRIEATVYGYVESVQQGLNEKSDNEMLSVIKIQRLDIADSEDPSKVLYSYTN